MSYNLNGKKILIYVNVTKYDSKDHRRGADVDERKIVDTFKEKVYLYFHKISIYLVYLNAWHTQDRVLKLPNDIFCSFNFRIGGVKGETQTLFRDLPKCSDIFSAIVCGIKKSAFPRNLSPWCYSRAEKRIGQFQF